MNTQSPRQLPNPFNGVEVGAVGRQKIQTHYFAMAAQPGPQQPGVMPSCIVHDDDHDAALSFMPDKLAQERLERLGVETILLAGDQPPVANPHGPKHAHALARRRVKEPGVGVFGRNPHGHP